MSLLDATSAEEAIMGFVIAGALAALVAIMLALSGSSGARRWLAGMTALIAAALLTIWVFQSQ
jgi:hypothetical protein